MNYKDLLQKQLSDFSSKGYNRTFTSIYRYKETFPFTKIDLPNEQYQKENLNPDTTVWCSNDYLNMSHNKEVIKRMIQVIKDIIVEKKNVTENKSDQGTYYSWPTIDEIKDFRKNGGRLI